MAMLEVFKPAPVEVRPIIPSIEVVRSLGSTPPAGTLDSTGETVGATLRADGADGTRWENIAGTSFPISGLYPGRPFFRTDIGGGELFRYISGSTWLGEKIPLLFGRSGTAASPATTFLKMTGNLTSSTNAGYPIGYNFRIVGYDFANGGSPLTAHVELMVGLTEIFSGDAFVSKNIYSEHDLAVDIAATSINGLAARIDAGVGTLTDPSLVVFVRRRET